MLDIVRTSLHRAITTPIGDGFLPVRLQKDFARRVNVLLGEPLCSREELARRQAGRAKLEELKKTGGKTPGLVVEAQAQAPVMVYFEKDRNVRLLGRIQEALDAKAIKYTLLDVAGDEGSKAFVLREAKCKDDDLPIVFVAGAVIGGYNELVDWDVSGRLAKALVGN
jgi:hypothetical protein